MSVHLLVCLSENQNPSTSLDAVLVISLCFLSRGSLRAFCLKDTSKGPICSNCLHVFAFASGTFVSFSGKRCDLFNKR